MEVNNQTHLYRYASVINDHISKRLTGRRSAHRMAKFPSHPFDPRVLTASELQSFLQDFKTTSVQLVETYLEQIETYNGYIHAVIGTAPKASLLDEAERLDQERKQGIVRSPMHGIPILVKVWEYMYHALASKHKLIKTCTGQHCDESCSGDGDHRRLLCLGRISAEEECRSRREGSAKPSITPVKFEAKYTTQLTEAGAIILGKANLSVSPQPDQTELKSSADMTSSGALLLQVRETRGTEHQIEMLRKSRGQDQICGWSAVGGQSQSAYVRGGLQEDDSPSGHSVSSHVSKAVSTLLIHLFAES